MNLNLVKRLFALGAAVFIAGCGAGGGGSSDDNSGGTDGGTTTGSAAVSIALTDATSGVVIDTLSSGVTGRVTATVRDADGDAVPGALVTFTTESNYATLNPASGTTLSDSSGVATALIAGGTTSGASTVNVKAVWKESGSDVTVANSVNYLVSATGTIALAISQPAFGTNPISSYGTTSVTVTVSGATSPMDVSFTSTCTASGKAILTPTVTTINNVATASYRDNGCGNVDTITASVTSGVTQSNQLTVSAPNAGSIQFVSATPPVISLKGTGSSTLPETSTVKFKILDTAGQPISKSVDFTLSTTLGGITFSNGATTASATSDASTGEVQVAVNGGTLPTPLRVLATINGTQIRTQSNQLTITTGLPDQAHTSLSASTHNIEGWEIDGTTTTLTMRLADHLGNPVPDGTPVNFVTEGGSIVGSCQTTSSSCNAVFSSQALRPSDGRVTVLAYAVGEEAFTDLNSNGTVDSAAEMIDANGNPTDIGVAFVDYDEDGNRDNNEPFYNYDGLVYRSIGDTFYNGILCTTGASICGAQKSVHVFASQLIILSGSQPVNGNIDMFVTSDNSTVINSIDLGGCTTPGATYSYKLRLRDVNRNPLPAGTKITIATDNGTISFGGSQVVPDTTSRYVEHLPGQGAFLFSFSIKNDAPVDSCTDSTPSGTLTVTIDPPASGEVQYPLSVIR